MVTRIPNDRAEPTTKVSAGRAADAIRAYNGFAISTILRALRQGRVFKTGDAEYVLHPWDRDLVDGLRVGSKRQIRKGGVVVGFVERTANGFFRGQQCYANTNKARRFTTLAEAEAFCRVVPALVG